MRWAFFEGGDFFGAAQCGAADGFSVEHPAQRDAGVARGDAVGVGAGADVDPDGQGAVDARRALHRFRAFLLRLRLAFEVAGVLQRPAYTQGLHALQCRLGGVLEAPSPRLQRTYAMIIAISWRLRK